MQTSTIATTLIAALALLQGVPAPGLPIAIGLGSAASEGATAGAAAGAASLGITAGIISGVVSGAVGAGISAATSRRDAFVYANKMAREVLNDIEKREEHIEKRQEDVGPGPAPAGVPQYNWDECYYAARGAQITVTGPVGDNHIRVEGVPASCGSDCIEYVNMTPEYYENMRALINTQVLHV